MYWSEADMEEKRRKGGKAKAAINSGNVNSHGVVLVGSSLQRLEERRKKRRIRDAQEAMRLGVSEEFRRTILLDYVSGKQG